MELYDESELQKSKKNKKISNIILIEFIINFLFNVEKTEPLNALSFIEVSFSGISSTDILAPFLSGVLPRR